MEAPLATEILLGIPEPEFYSVRWNTMPSWQAFQADLSFIASDLPRGIDNSLFAQ